MFCDTHFYLNLSSLGAKISARCHLCHKPSKCYCIVSCSPLILIGPHFLSLAINQLYDLSLFPNIVKKRPCSEINAFKNLDPVSQWVGSAGPICFKIGIGAFLVLSLAELSATNSSESNEAAQNFESSKVVIHRRREFFYDKNIFGDVFDIK